jgi:hypothetical protein
MNSTDNRDAVSYLASELTMLSMGFPSLKYHEYYSDIIRKAIKQRGLLIDGKLVCLTIDKASQAS